MPNQVQKLERNTKKKKNPSFCFSLSCFLDDTKSLKFSSCFLDDT